MKSVKKRSPSSDQRWATFIRNHLHQTWACDFLQTHDIFFQTIFAFFIIELGSRKVVHFAVTRSPSRQWVAQQPREATPFAEGSRFLIRDNDDTFGPEFDNVAKSVFKKVLLSSFGRDGPICGVAPPRNSAASPSSSRLFSWTVALRNTRSDLIKHALRHAGRKFSGLRFAPREQILFVRDLSGVLGGSAWITLLSYQFYRCIGVSPSSVNTSMNLDLIKGSNNGFLSVRGFLRKPMARA